MSRNGILCCILLWGMAISAKADVLNFELDNNAATIVSIDLQSYVPTGLNPANMIINQDSGKKYFNGNINLDKSIDTTATGGKLGAITYNQTGNPSITNYYAYDAGYSYQYWFGFALSQENQSLSSLSQSVIDNKDFLSYQYSSAPGAGAELSDTYAIGYIDLYNTDGTLSINFETAVDLQSIFLTNATYTAACLKYGSAFSEPFGSDDKLTLSLKGITGIDGDDNPIYLEDASGDVIIREFTLADGENILSNWSLLNLSDFVGVTGLEFSMQTTDVGAFGPNTPYYFALDNLTYALPGVPPVPPVPPASQGVPEPSAWALLLLGLFGLWTLKVKRNS